LRSLRRLLPRNADGGARLLVVLLGAAVWAHQLVLPLGSGLTGVPLPLHESALLDVLLFLRLLPRLRESLRFSPTR
jgi:hypothetical protein